MLVLDDFGRPRLDILHTSQVGIESIVVQTSQPRRSTDVSALVDGAALVAPPDADAAVVAQQVEGVAAPTPAHPRASSPDDTLDEHPDLARGRKPTLSEGPSERARLATSPQPEPSERPAPNPGSDEGASMRLRPDLADATSRHRRALETRRDLPTTLPDGIAAAQAVPHKPVTQPTPAIQTEVARSPLLPKAASSPPAKAGMSVLAMTVLAGGVATLIGLGAWLALRVEAGIAAKEHDRAAREAVDSAHAQMAEVARVAAAPTQAAKLGGASDRETAGERRGEPAAEATNVASDEAGDEVADEAGDEANAAAQTEANDQAPTSPVAGEAAAAPDPAVEAPDPADQAPPTPRPVSAKAAAADDESAPDAPAWQAPAARVTATHEVVGTATDRESPWLALREDASASSQLLAQLPDGTGLRVLGRNKRWMRVQVLEGADQGSIGWVNGRWVSHR